MHDGACAQIYTGTMLIIAHLLAMLDRDIEFLVGVAMINYLQRTCSRMAYTPAVFQN